ncbi:MAG TPA: hypothetical protein VH372_15290 [Actinospica sp.]|jgi:hypothetical protein|nr:hypothetical protein [Actinospica sp.]
MSESVDPLGAEPCAHCAATARAEPAPVLGPYLGVVGAVLCSLAGAFLLLAPYAFDYRDGAATMPHSSTVDLATGGGVLLLGLLTAALFGGALARRLRAPEPAAEYLEPLQWAESAEAAEPTETASTHVGPVGTPGAGPGTGYNAAQPAHERAPEPVSEPEARPLAPAASLADPGGALRDLLTPLVAALAADLRARENGESEGNSR